MNKKITFWTNQEAVQALNASLNGNHVSITSTDTILGFLALPTASGVQKLNDLKGGRQEKTYLLLIASQDKLPAFVDMATIDTRIQKIMDIYWPGPLTIVFKAKQGLSKHLVADGLLTEATSPQGAGCRLETIALRCPQHDDLRQLLVSFDGLLSTSVNKSGQPAALTVDQIPEDILCGIDCVVINDGQGPTLGKPSTIIDVSQPGVVKVLRQGALIVDEY